MTVTSEEPKRRGTGTRSRGPASTEPVREVCPYLIAADGGWRSVQATRDHQCTATTPASPPSVSKQRELCLVPAHFGCATYQAAHELEAASRAAEPADGGLWPETRSAVLALEPASSHRTMLSGPPARTGYQALLVGLMVVAFVVLALARVTPPSLSGEPPASFAAGVASDGIADASLDPATAVPTAEPTATVEPSVEPSPSAVPSPSATAAPGKPSPGASASAAAGTTYKVRSGDTLSGIAARFGITVKALKAANGITDANLIRPGQVLVIPD